MSADIHCGNLTAGPGGKEREPLSPALIVASATLCVAILIAVVGNVATIVAFAGDRGLREKASNMLILSLSCSDLCVAVFVTTGTLGNVLFSSCWPFGEIFCRIWISLMMLLVYQGPLIVAAICLDRYLLVSRDYPRYLTAQTRCSVRITICASWLLTALLCLVENILWSLDPAEMLGKLAGYSICRSPTSGIAVYTIVVNATYTLVPFIFVAICSSRFLILLQRKLKRHRNIGPSTTADAFSRVPSTVGTGQVRRVHPQVSKELSSPASLTEYASKVTPLPHLAPPRSDVPPSDGRQRTFQPSPSRVPPWSEVDSRTRLIRNRYVRPTITVVCLVAALAVCYLPHCFYFLFVVSVCPTCASESTLSILYALRLYNSCLDPILYAATQKRIRAFYGRRFRHMIRLLRNVF